MIMTLNQEFILMLDYLGFSKQKILKFYKKFINIDNLYELFKTNTETFYSLFSFEEIKKIKSAISSGIGLKTAQKLAKLGIFALFYGEDDYPESLINIPDSPVVLYGIGDKRLLSETLISIIGTRTPTRYGKDVTEIFTKSLSSAGLVTVSGLAYGLDGMVASSTLDVNGKTIAVLGGGLDKIYPSNNTELARKIVKNGGLLLSDYLPGVRPQAHFFIERNRIIAGLSLGLIVTEAGEESGTFSTIKFALDYGKELFVVPGNITAEKCKGTNKIIAEIPHSFTISPVEVLERLGLDILNKSLDIVQNKIEISSEEKVILNLLKEDEISFDELQELTNFNVKTLTTLLTTMEINGLIEKLPGNYYKVKIDSV